MEMVQEEAATQPVLALDHFIHSQLLPTPNADKQSCFLSARRGSKLSEQEALSCPAAALATALGRNIPAQTSRSAKPAAIPGFLCLPMRARFVSASPDAMVESRKVKERKLFITAAHGNAISPAFRQGAVLIYRLMNFK